MATTIGKLIEQEVRRQGRSITAFADEICCTRTNVYDIFGRNKMDVAQLELISKVLGHNFLRIWQKTLLWQMQIIPKLKKTFRIVARWRSFSM